MKKQVHFSTKSLFFIAFFGIFSQNSLFSQCLTAPVSIEQRVEKSERICVGHVVSSEAYDGHNGKIYTLNTVQVLAWLKGASAAAEVGVITVGGFLQDRGMIATPSLKLNEQDDFLLFLEAENTVFDDKNARAKHPKLSQAEAYAGPQGALKYQSGLYHDLHFAPKTEAEIFQQIANLTGVSAKKPNGTPFPARIYEIPATPEVVVITGFSPTTTNAGTIVATEYLTITGSGFGATQGASTVGFKNGDDGGATFINPAIASDYVSWSDNQIVVKVPDNAGTGQIQVNTVTSAGTLTVNYSHLDVESSFYLWGSTNRNRYYHRNLNSLGGYSFKYNNTSPTGPTSMANTPLATAAFERALQTWRCQTFINFVVNGTTSTATVSDDGTNTVFFNPNPNAGTLGVAYSFYNASGTASCQQANTVWWQSGVDVEFSNPPLAGYTWQYGPAAPSGSQFDFESVTAHELGHACGLGHRIAPGEMMHYAISNGTMNRYPVTNEVNGVVARVAYSTAATCFNPPAAGTPMVAATAGNCSTAVLPIELMRFYCETHKNLIRLNWATATETNNDRFEIERSTDGEIFEKIGQLAGRGHSLEETDYLFEDKNPTAGLNYYRLRQVDFDGKESFSTVCASTFLGKTGSLTVAPNPATDEIFISGKTETVVRLINSLGQEVRRQLHDGSKTRLDVSDLPTGIYFLTDDALGEKIEIFINPRN